LIKKGGKQIIKDGGQADFTKKSTPVRMTGNVKLRGTKEEPGMAKKWGWSSKLEGAMKNRWGNVTRSESVRLQSQQGPNFLYKNK